MKRHGPAAGHSPPLTPHAGPCLPHNWQRDGAAADRFRCTTCDVERAETASEAWARFLGRWDWPWFVTHTFRAEIAPEAACKRWRVWVSKLNRHLCGRNWHKHGRGVSWARAIELQRRGVIHYHALVCGEGVESARRLDWMDNWAALDCGWSRIEPPVEADAVAAYCSKYVVKGGEIDLGGPIAKMAGCQAGIDFSGKC